MIHITVLSLLLIGIWGKEIYVFQSSNEVEICLQKNKCDGSLEKPFNSFLTAMQGVFDENENETRVVILSKTNVVSKVHIDDFLVSTSEAICVFNRKDFGSKRKIYVDGRSNESTSAESFISKKVSLIVEGTLFSMLLQNTEMIFSHVDLVLSNQISICSDTPRYFVKIASDSAFELFESSISLKGSKIIFADSFLDLESGVLRLLYTNISFVERSPFELFLKSKPIDINLTPAIVLLGVNFFFQDFVNIVGWYAFSSYLNWTNVSFETNCLYFSFEVVKSRVTMTDCVMKAEISYNILNMLSIIFLNATFSSVTFKKVTIYSNSSFEYNSPAIFMMLWDQNEFHGEELFLKELSLFPTIYLKYNNKAFLKAIRINNSLNTVFILESNNYFSLTDSLFFNCSNDKHNDQSKGADIYMNSYNDGFLVFNTSFLLSKSYVTCLFILKKLNSRAFLSGKFGGVLYINQLNRMITVRGCYFRENYARKDGGSIVINLENSDILIEQTEFFRNFATSFGGAMLIDTNNSNIVFRLCYFIENNSSERTGGVLYIYKGNTVIKISESCFQKNTARQDGGAVYSHFSNSYFSITFCTFTGNYVNQGLGGVFSAQYTNNDFWFSLCTFEDNFSEGFGGIIHFYQTNFNVAFASCYFENNWAANDCGVIFIYQENTNFTINYCFLKKNYGATDGGAIYLSYLNSDIKIKASAFTENFIRQGNAGSLEINEGNENIYISQCIFLGNHIEKGNGGVMEFYRQNTQITIRSCVFLQNRADQNKAGCLFLDLGNFDFTVDSCIFFKNSGSRGTVFYLSSSNSNIRISKNLFLFHSGSDGGVIYLETSNEFILFYKCYFSDNTADRGAALFTNEKNNFSVDSSVFDYHIAKIVELYHWGVFYLSSGNQANLKNIFFNFSESLFYGAIAYSKSSSNIYIENCSFRECSSRLGAVFFVGDGSSLVVNASNFRKFTIQIQLSEIFRLDGNMSDLTITECSFQMISNLLLNDFGINSIIKILGSVLCFLEEYSTRGVFILNSKHSSYNIRSNTFIFKGKSAIDFDYFIQINENSSSLYLKQNALDYGIFPVLVSCTQLWRNNITIESLQLEGFKGTLIFVKSSPLLSDESPNSNITLLNSKLKIAQSSSHFIELKSYASYRIENCLLYFGEKQTYSFIFSKNLNYFLGASNYVLVIQSSQFLILKTKKAVSSEPETHQAFGLIHSENALNKIYLLNSMINIGMISLAGIFQLEGDLTLNLNHSKIFNNLFNRSNSHLILIKFHSPPIVLIFHSLLQFNRVVMGGLISFEGKVKFGPQKRTLLILLENNIQFNFAINKGGVLYFNVSWETEKELTRLLALLSQEENFKNNNLRKNRASLGASVFWEGYYVPPKENLTRFAKILLNGNRRENPGVGSSVNSLRITDFDSANLEAESLPANIFLSSGNRYKILQKVVKNDISPELFYFCLALYDKYNQFLNIASENFLNASYGKVSMVPFLLFDQANANISFQFIRSMFCAKKFNFYIKYSNIVGHEFTITIHKDYFLTFFNNMDKTLPKEALISFQVDNCKVGEYFDEEKCIPCEINKFSLLPNLRSLTECNVCTVYDDFYCYGGSLRSPKQNFWRFDKETDTFLRCPTASCLGDENYYKNSSHRDCLDCFLPGTKRTELFYSYIDQLSGSGYCKTPYQGFLCTQCQKNFGSTGVYRCGDCSSSLTYLKEFLVMFVKLLIFLFSNWKALKSKMDIDARKSKEFISEFQSTLLLKVLFKHFAILSVLKTLPLNLSESLNDTISALLNMSPTESHDVFSFECFLTKIGISLAPIYTKLIFNLVFFSTVYIIFLLSLKSTQQVDAKGKLIQFLLSDGHGILFIFILDNLLLLIEPYFKVLFIVNIGDEKRVNTRLLSDFSLKAWDELHKFFLFTFSIPCIAIFTIILPIFLLFKIKIARTNNQIKSESFMKNFGYFTFPYKKTALYFEILIIYNRLILVVFTNLIKLSVLTNDQLGYLLLFFLYFIIFYYFQSYVSPYEPKKFSSLQKIELKSLALSISNVLCAIIWTLAENTEVHQLLAYWMIIIYFSLSNIAFFILWFFHYFEYFKLKLVILGKMLKPIFKKGSHKASEDRKSLNEIEYKTLYLESLKTIKALESEILELNNFNKTLRKNLDFFEERTNVIYEEGTPRKKFHDTFASRGCEKRPVNTAGPPKVTRKMTLNPKYIGMEKEGDDFSNHICRFKIELNENLLPSINLCSFTCSNKEWVLKACELKNNILELTISRLAEWVEPPFKDIIAIDIRYKHHSQENSEEEVVSEYYHLGVDLNDFIKSSVTTSWEQAQSDLEQKEKPLFEIQFSPEKFSEVFLSLGDPKFVQASTTLHSVIWKRKVLNLDLYLEKNGSLKAFAGNEYNKLESFLKNCIYQKYK